MNELVRRRLAALALLATLMFGYPVLAVVDALARCCLPAVLPVWIFLAWAVVIALARWVLGSRDGAP